jgi:hypothetical protein
MGTLYPWRQSYTRIRRISDIHLILDVCMMALGPICNEGTESRYPFNAVER